jgi:hypothetical protein
MPTWEDLLGPFVGLANQFQCATCLNAIFRGSTGHFGQKIILNHKLAAPGGLRDNAGHAVTFQCGDCAGREPILAPIVHPNGALVNHINISELKDSGEKPEIKTEVGDYDLRKDQVKEVKQAMEQKKPLATPMRKKTIDEIQEEHAQHIIDANNYDEDTDDLEE